MQNAPELKGSGLNPEPLKTDEAVHVFGSNIKEKIEEDNSTSFDIVSKNDAKQEDDIESIKKRKFDAMTGEEDEETVFQGDFKLFSWDLITSNWVEKGRGQLKLNDSLDTQNPESRLIMRLSGTLRIILNVAIRHPTFRVITNTKTSIRFTDSQTVWAASGTNAHQLTDLIEHRLKDGKRLKADDTKSEENVGKTSQEKDQSTDSIENKKDQTTDSTKNENDQSTEPNEEGDHSTETTENKKDLSTNSDQEKDQSIDSTKREEDTRVDNISKESANDPSPAPRVEPTRVADEEDKSLTVHPSKVNPQQDDLRISRQDETSENKD